MKSILRNHLQERLIAAAKTRLEETTPKPTLITITGSVGKTSMKEAIVTALGGAPAVLTSPGNYNTEIGVPLTLLELEGGEGSVWAWRSILKEVKQRAHAPWNESLQYIVLELAVDHPGDMEVFRQFITPDIAVVTPIPQTPVHGAFFPSEKAVAKEKGKMIKGVKEGTVFLDASEELTRNLQNSTGMNVQLYGVGETTDLSWEEPQFLIDDNGPHGLVGKVRLQGTTLPLRLQNVIATTQFTAAAVALAVASEAGENPVTALERLESWSPPERRMQRKQTADGMVVIDDTYNASPLAMKKALEWFTSFPVLGRRIAVLGDMRELDPKKEQRAHETVGRQAADVADVLICVGEYGEWVAKAARSKNTTMRVETVMTSQEAYASLQKLKLAKDDVVFCKASRSIELDTLVDQLVQETRV